MNTKQIVQALRKQGWTVTITRNQHLRCCPPDAGPFVIIASTPSDYRSLLNTKAQLRRSGARL